VLFAGKPSLRAGVMLAFPEGMDRLDAGGRDPVERNQKPPDGQGVSVLVGRSFHFAALKFANPIAR